MDGPLRLGVVGVGALTLRGLLPHLHLEDVRDRVRDEALCDPGTRQELTTTFDLAPLGAVPS